MEKDARAEIRKDVLKEFKAAEREPRPRLRGMFEDVYEEITEEAQSQIDELRGVIQRYGKEYDVSAFEGGLKGLDDEDPNRKV